MTLLADVASLEPLQLPDFSRREPMPSLPAWVDLRIASLATAAQPDAVTGKYREALTLPSSLILSPSEREVLNRHVAQLEQFCLQTPDGDVRWQEDVWTALTEIMLVIPAAAQNEISVEARGKAYMLAVSDIPAWATAAAVVRWYRGECGRDEQGKPYQYRWLPAPAEVRRIANLELHRVKHRINQLRRLLGAEPLIEHSEEHRRQMGERLAELAEFLRSSSVGSTAAAR